MSKLTICRPVNDLFVSSEINKLVKQPRYDFDVLLNQFGFLVERKDDITIYELVERVRKYSDNFKTQLLCDAVELQAKELLGD